MHEMILFQKRDMNATKNFMTKKVKSRRGRKEGLMSCSKCRKKPELPIPVDPSVFSGKGSLQMSIEVGMENGKTMDIRKSNDALLEMFSIVRTSQIELLSPIAFVKYWML